jgi:predicted nucleic acid-binding protein
MPIFQIIDDGKMSAVTSVISLLEVLTQPLRLGNNDLCLQYHDLLSNAEHLRLTAIDSTIARKAALVRAKYSIRTPDALQIATAIETGCDAFLTNDAAFKRVKDITVLLLDDFDS